MSSKIFSYFFKFILFKFFNNESSILTIALLFNSLKYLPSCFLSTFFFRSPAESVLPNIFNPANWLEFSVSLGKPVLLLLSSFINSLVDRELPPTSKLSILLSTSPDLFFPETKCKNLIIVSVLSPLIFNISVFEGLSLESNVYAVLKKFPTDSLILLAAEI